MKCPGHDDNQTCSMHGTCDKNSGKCSCDDGFYSEDCSSNVFKNRDSESVVFNSGQKMALRAFYFIRALTKALTYYYISRSQRHLLAAIENN